MAKKARIDGKDHWLGKYGSPASHLKYDEIISEWLTRHEAQTQIATPG